MNNPEVIQALKAIANDNGGELRAADVVEAARPPQSPLHSHFDWDDTEAASKWRIEQARRLIRVVVEVVGPKEQPTSTRVFVSLSTDRKKEEGGYRITAAVLSNERYREQLLADALAEMEFFNKKYSALKELAEVFSAIKTTTNTIKLSQGIVGEHPSPPAKSLAANGAWQVPPEQRPRGWEKMPVREPAHV